MREWADASFRERDGLVTRTDRVVAPTAIDTRPLRERKEGEGRSWSIGNVSGPTSKGRARGGGLLVYYATASHWERRAFSGAIISIKVD